MAIRTKRANITRMGPADILQGLGPDMFRDAYSQGMSLSGYMERMNPSTVEDRRAGYDAFSRVLRESDVITRSIPEAGVWADTWGDCFDETPQQRLLGLEWAARQWRRAQVGLAEQSGQRDIMLSDDYPIGSAMRPYVDNANLRLQVLQAAIPLSSIVAITTPISGNTYRAVYLTDTTNAASTRRFVRVGESGEIPSVTLREESRTMTIYKFGRKLESSYEILRRQRLDRIALEIALMAIQAEKDKVDVALDTIVSGDGNAGTAATNYNLSVMDTGSTVGTLSLPGYLNWKLQWEQPYALTTILANTGSALQALLINTGSANIPLVSIAAASGFGGFTPINPGLSDNVGLGWLSSAPTGKLVGFDRRVTLERVTEIGSDITEVERYASRQTQAIIMTETEGYDVIDPRGTKTLDLNN